MSTKTTINAYVPISVDDDLRQKAKERNMSLSSYIARLLTLLKKNGITLNNLEIIDGVEK